MGNKIVTPTTIQHYAVNWYHMYLMHIGMDLTEAAISQHYYRPKLRDDIHTQVKVFKTGQKNKNKNENAFFYPQRKWMNYPWTDYG